MRLIKLIIFLLVLTPAAFAQSNTVEGTIKDTSANMPIYRASVSVLRLQDSILQAYTRTDNKGHFKISSLKDGDYFLLVTYPKYAEYVELFSVADGQTENLNLISLIEAAKLLDEIVISQPSILIKGDTTEYMADSFKVRENASVEDLLKVLPGIQVDKDGKIIAQGKQVQKVLVDGDEFFSDDPTIATKNLRADAIKKVQVYDKKSDQAAFTGIDDGQEVKTIDLQLKDDAKKGYFGKVSLAGLDKYYNATGMINSFKAKRKLSAFGVASTTSQTGLDFSDQSSLGFGGGGGMFMGGGGRGGGIVVVGGRGGGFSGGGGGLSAGNDYGQGLPESVKAGLHYSDKWSEGKNSAGGNYLFNQVDTRAGGNTFSQNTLEDSVYYNRNTSTNNSSRLQHSISGEMEIKFDSTSQMRVTVNGNTGTTSSTGQNFSEVLSEEMSKVNTSDNQTSDRSDFNSLSTNAFYRKRFKKEGRNMSINFSQRYNDSKSDGFLNNKALFFDKNGDLIRQDLTDQNKVNSTVNQTWEVRASYMNPLGGNSYLEFNYSFNNNNNDQKRLSYDKDGTGKYQELVDSLSSDFKYTYNTNSGGINYSYQGKKLNVTAGGNISHTAVDQDDRFENNGRSYSYTNLFPRGTVRYRFNSFSSLSLNYNGSTTQPTIDQLQPLKNNSDPMNIVVGNPDLKQSFSNIIGLNYNSFQLMKDQYVFAGFNFNTTANQINSSYTIDEFGKQVTKYINVNGNYSMNLFSNFSRRIGKKNWRAGISPNISWSQNSNFINGQENRSKSLNITPAVNISNRLPDRYEFSLDYRPSYNSSKSSISTASDRNYWIQNLSFDGRYTFPLKIDLGTEVQFEYREKLNEEDTKNQVMVWNAFIEKRFLSKEQLTLRFSINDILDQNKGYERVIQPNAIVERNYLTFQRYGLITLSYNFNTTGSGGRSSSASPGRSIRF